MNKLNAILGKEEAKEQFIEKNATLEEAFSYTGIFEEVFQDSIVASLKSLEKANNLLYKIKKF